MTLIDGLFGNILDFWEIFWSLPLLKSFKGFPIANLRTTKKSYRTLWLTSNQNIMQKYSYPRETSSFSRVWMQICRVRFPIYRLQLTLGGCHTPYSTPRPPCSQGPDSEGEFLFKNLLLFWPSGILPTPFKGLKELFQTPLFDYLRDLMLLHVGRKNLLHQR